MSDLKNVLSSKYGNYSWCMFGSRDCLLVSCQLETRLSDTEKTTVYRIDGSRKWQKSLVGRRDSFGVPDGIWRYKQAEWSSGSLQLKTGWQWHTSELVRGSLTSLRFLSNNSVSLRAKLLWWLVVLVSNRGHSFNEKLSTVFLFTSKLKLVLSKKSFWRANVL